jgi:hypothetical protein
MNCVVVKLVQKLFNDVVSVLEILFPGRGKKEMFWKWTREDFMNSV